MEHFRTFRTFWKLLGSSELKAQTNELEYRIKMDQLERNRELNRQINKDYEEIGQRLDIEIETTANLVDTITYFKK